MVYYVVNTRFAVLACVATFPHEVVNVWLVVCIVTELCTSQAGVKIHDTSPYSSVHIIFNIAIYFYCSSSGLYSLLLTYVLAVLSSVSLTNI